MQYILTRKAGGLSMTADERQLPNALLEIAGGGYTEQQTRNAMRWGDQLRQGETVETAKWSIRPVSEYGK